MELDILQKVAQELNSEIVGSVISKIFQPLPRELGLKIFLPGKGERRLMLSADPKLGRIHLTKLRIPNPPRPPRFCAFLRAHLTNARIVKISCATGDRVVTISCELRSVRPYCTRNLILELLGRDSNILIVDAEQNLIMDCLHRIPDKGTLNRIVTPGIPYMPPLPNPNKFSSSSKNDIETKVISGIGSSNHRRISEDVREEPKFSSSLLDINDQVDHFFTDRLTKSLVENLRREICKPIRAKIRGLVTRIQKIENDEQKLKSYIEHGKWGELLKSVIGNFKKGMTFVEVNEWQSGTTVKISLDPSLDLVSNMRKFFAHSAKGKRGIVITKERLEKTIQEKMALEELLYFLEQAKTQEELEILSSEIHLTKRLEFHPDKKNKKNPVTRGKTSSNYLEFKSPSGFNVFVGRNSLGNDFILRTKVKPDDIWFHVNNAPGSHVAMISRGNENFPDQDIYFGATLAAKHSKLGKAGKIEVIYTMVKNVSRIKGGFLGQVKIGKHNTVVVDLGK